VAYLARHGGPGDPYLFPHRINHPANLWALNQVGVQEVVTINSTGSLKPDIRPGSLVIPHDFISLFDIPTTVKETPLHITPALDETVRAKLILAAKKAKIPVKEGGIYWQTQGPRLETRAEIALMSRFADLVGMTLGGEVTVACELNLPLGALCSVDNYAHGVSEPPLSEGEIRRAAARHAQACLKILREYLKIR
jgi:5'-methylthioadenosine phosphorylase